MMDRNQSQYVHSRIQIISQKHERLMNQLNLNMERIEISKQQLCLNREKMNLLREKMQHIRDMQSFISNLNLDEIYQYNWMTNS
ncbi:hypothetical protein [Paenibacillus hexagrammi]|uniref:Uncharacterized protein n=1 Tax=Paenibacillus hexagrammi TaxID=2908839 RepID=A0ABY3SJU1_9BACL|nr:hypothetical protein [Paenibacillus sp. YPD9-1]UJF34112.1 hypothetical protein L0M14_02415 [Paenibacillus sp. YPD9-1]